MQRKVSKRQIIVRGTDFSEAVLSFTTSEKAVGVATKVWQRMEDEEWGQYLVLKTMHEETPQRQHAWFPRSLLRLENNPLSPDTGESYHSLFLVFQ